MAVKQDISLSPHLKAELAVTCSTLGRLHKGEYLIEPECMESVKDLIRHLKRDREHHEIRIFLGESKVLQNDLVHIIKSCPDENSELFDVTLRLLINLTTPALLFYGEDIPRNLEKRQIYLRLVGYSQDYKSAFCDVEFWNKICGKLTDLFEIDWVERSVDQGIQIERMLMLLRNVLQVPADFESEQRPDNDITIHDKVLWALRQSQILELLLFISSNSNEEQFYLNLLEIFSLILREQNPKLLANSDMETSTVEKTQETEELIKVRECEKMARNKYANVRNFNTTFVMKGIKSFSNNDVVCHKSLDKIKEMDLNRSKTRKKRVRGFRIPVESDRIERRSTFSVRLFLKEFCLEFLSNSFNHLMNVVKNKLDSGKSLANDQTYYFWALKFFLDFATASDSDVELIRNFLSPETFHFVQTSMDNAFDHLKTDKKKGAEWIKRIHLILKTYRSLLEALLWMDSSKSPLTRSISREIKQQIFYVVEYREMILHLLVDYDSTKFSLSYLRDLIETTHLFVKLLEEFSKQTKLTVQKIQRKKSSSKKSEKTKEKPETREEKWEKIKDDVYDTLCSESCFPEIPPFDAALDIPIDDQKGRAMKNIQKLLHQGNVRDGIGLLRSARQVWPENDFFGSEGMSVEDETMALQEICIADLGEIEPPPDKEEENVEGNEAEELDGESRVRIVEQDFDIMEYMKRLVHKKVVEGCGILLKNYNKNSDHTNHCVIKLLHRIGWECAMPAMLFQASLFWTLLKILKDKTRDYREINTFTVNLLRKFRKAAEKNSVVFLELLFWKERKVALEIQLGYDVHNREVVKSKPGRKKKSNKVEGNENEMPEESEMNGNEEKKTRKRKSKKTSELVGSDVSEDENDETLKSKDDSGSDSESDENGISALNRWKSLRSAANKEQSSSLNLGSTKPVETQEDLLETPKETKKSKNNKVKTQKHSNLRRSLLDSSDEETENQQNLVNSDEEITKPQKTIPYEKDSDHSTNSQTSNASSKKRARENNISKSKRVRYIGSDSDVDLESGDEEPISGSGDGGKKRRRRLAIIDSDSDVEANSLDEK